MDLYGACRSLSSKDECVKNMFAKIADLRALLPPGRRPSQAGWEEASKDNGGPSMVDVDDIQVVESPLGKKGASPATSVSTKTPSPKTNASSTSTPTCSSEVIKSNLKTKSSKSSSRTCESSSSGRSAEQKQLDLLTTEIKELEGKLESRA